MPKPYSIDFRGVWVVAAVETDKFSRRQAAVRFGVRVSMAIN